MPIYEYKCKKCGKVQEKFHKISEELEEGCDNSECDGEAVDLEKHLSPMSRHVSWSKWSV